MGVIERVDDSVMAAIAEQLTKTPGQPEIIPFTDGEMVKAFMTQLTIRQNARVDAAEGRG